MDTASLHALFVGLFDDASLYPPAATELPDAVRQNAGHRLAWYSDMVGPFVCNTARLHALDEQVRKLGLDVFDVAVVVPEGIDAVPAARAALEQCDTLRVAAYEIPVGQSHRDEAMPVLTKLRKDAVVYVEVPIELVSEHTVHQLCGEGLRLKLRTGGTSIDAFRSEAELARPIVMCAAERLAFKCTAGLHNAVRHRDPASLFEHHGFLNLALAARVAAATGSASTTAETLAEHDAAALAYRVGDLGPADIAAIRALFMSFGTCSIAEPIADLTAMGLVSVP